MEATQENQQPLLPESVAPSMVPRKQPKTPAQRAMRKTFKGTAHLANLLPTGTVLVFQILSPVLTDQGRCPTAASWGMTLCLIGLSAISCFVCSFTDSIRDSRGKVRYGLATFRGIYIMDASVVLSPEETAKYRLRLIDFFHAFMTSMVFGAVTLFDRNVVKCFYPEPSEDARELLVEVPVCIGIVCSLFFIAFPTKRHGIGFPLSRE
ncbi:protein DMP7 [Punica granatum]|uniref:Uncharacterized protein n=2 Tax=Punica granatum TaxID=22663 RepID=A0A218X0H6_PUNGR|nr:protein DMP7 [Punica granatum]OWM78675.1 hypothetical protein CDL15_Pgr002846 [Punica granatum]PKI42730.1 hypothetical protein CRG98_036858 [Punica granatum]